MKIRSYGFTIIEIIIVITIIASLTAIVVPSYFSYKIHTNESAALTHIRNIGIAQNEMRARADVDQDGDGYGEYALLGELGGSVNIRSLASKRYNMLSIMPPVAGKSYGEADGYCFRVYLPVPTGSSVVTDNGVTDPTSVTANASLQENRYRVYAWPKVAGSTGKLVFMLDEKNALFAANNIKPTAVNNKTYLYTQDQAPAYNAAFPTSDTVEFSATAVEGTGSDGMVWKKYNK